MTLTQKTGILILGTIIFSASIVVILYFFSNKINYEQNSFIRVFPPHVIRDVKKMDIEYNSYYIAGVDSSHIFLGNSTAPLHLLKINKKLTDSNHIRLKIKNINDIKLHSIRVHVDFDNFYIVDGTVPFVLKGDLVNWSASNKMFNKAYFTQSIPVSKRSIVISSIDESNEIVLGKQTVDSPYVKLYPNLLHKQIDGFFW